MVKQRNEIDGKIPMGFVDKFLRQIKLWEEEAASLAADIKAASHYAGHCWIQRKRFWIQPMLIWN